MKREIEEIKALGSSIIPAIDYKDLMDVGKRATFRDSLHKRGVAIIRNVVTEETALEWKEMLKSYIEANPATRGRSLSSVLCPWKASCCCNVISSVTPAFS